MDNDPTSICTCSANISFREVMLLNNHSCQPLAWLFSAALWIHIYVLLLLWCFLIVIKILLGPFSQLQSVFAWVSPTSFLPFPQSLTVSFHSVPFQLRPCAFCASVGRWMFPLRSPPFLFRPCASGASVFDYSVTPLSQFSIAPLLILVPVHVKSFPICLCFFPKSWAVHFP